MTRTNRYENRWVFWLGCAGFSISGLGQLLVIHDNVRCLGFLFIAVGIYYGFRGRKVKSRKVGLPVDKWLCRTASSRPPRPHKEVMDRRPLDEIRDASYRLSGRDDGKVVHLTISASNGLLRQYLPKGMDPRASQPRTSSRTNAA